MSFGKFNCILKLDGTKEDLLQIYNEVIELFKPDEIYTSLFNLDILDMEDFDVFVEFEDDNCIRKIIFEKGVKEKIIIEYYKGQFIIKHLFSINNNFSHIGNKTINNYFYKETSAVLIFGFELSILISIFDDSLDEHKKDGSIHPLIVIVKSINNIKIEEFISDDSTINDKKIEIINGYIGELGIDIKNNQ